MRTTSMWFLGVLGVTRSAACKFPGLYLLSPCAVYCISHGSCRPMLYLGRGGPQDQDARVRHEHYYRSPVTRKIVQRRFPSTLQGESKKAQTSKIEGAKLRALLACSGLRTVLSDSTATLILMFYLNSGEKRRGTRILKWFWFILNAIIHCSLWPGFPLLRRAGRDR